MMFLFSGKKRDPNRIPIVLERLGVLWSHNYDLRLGQLISWVIVNEQRLFNMEDDELLERINKLLEEYEK